MLLPHSSRAARLQRERPAGWIPKEFSFEKKNSKKYLTGLVQVPVVLNVHGPGVAHFRDNVRGREAVSGAVKGQVSSLELWGRVSHFALNQRPHFATHGGRETLGLLETKGDVVLPGLELLDLGDGEDVHEDIGWFPAGAEAWTGWVRGELVVAGNQLDLSA